eukprot:TRINITY_DN19995_c0_g1_i1.p1 TRINITY_DN19995_c0_g1~~TRINITY_DN19995_c0_g1_i1.p1  ORF type:complete len:181 (-),score=43.34 TRINITY_DN19995_c0_g1_i1:8-487(-)
MVQLRDKIEVDERQREASCPAPAKSNDNLEAEVRPHVSPKRCVAFRLEKNVGQVSTSRERSDGENLPQLTKERRLWPGDMQKIAEGDPAMQRLLQAARDAVEADEQERQQEQVGNSVVPTGRERATRRPSKLRPIGHAGDSSTRLETFAHDQEGVSGES